MNNIKTFEGFRDFIGMSKRPETNEELKEILDYLREEYRKKSKYKFDFIVHSKFDIQKYLEGKSISEKHNYLQFFYDYYNRLPQQHSQKLDEDGKSFGYVKSPFRKDPVIDMEEIFIKLNEKKSNN